MAENLPVPVQYRLPFRYITCSLYPTNACAMNTEAIIGQLEQNAETFAALVAGIGSDEALWKPADDKWSVLEVVNHLADEERVDFRQRLDLTLHSPEQDWPETDPERAVHDARYAGRGLAEALADFREERDRSVQWLRSLDRPDWDSTHHHPHFPSIDAGTLLASWLAHDYLHIRQIARIRYSWLEQHARPYSLAYAG